MKDGKSLANSIIIHCDKACFFGILFALCLGLNEFSKVNGTAFIAMAWQRGRKVAKKGLECGPTLFVFGVY